MTPEQVGTELQAMRGRLDELDPGSVDTELLLRRADLRQAAQEAVDAARTSAATQAELDRPERRFAAFESEKINIAAWRAAMASQSKSAWSDSRRH